MIPIDARLGALLSVALLTAGCSLVADFRAFEFGDAGLADAGASDAGLPDAAPRDASLDSGADGGALDGGALDSGGVDGGALDSGGVDGGALDAGAPLPSIDQIVAGDNHFCVRVAGDVACWGGNRNRQVSPSDEFYFDVPEPVALPAAATWLVADDDRTCAVLTDRTVVCWGLSDRLTAAGQFPVPTDIGLTDVLEIGLGDMHACALHVGGSVRCWGDNADGQLGQGDRTDATTPLVVAGIEAEHVAVGGDHSCARLTDQTVRCWGNNSRLESGGASQTDFLVPGPRIERDPSGVFDDLTAMRCDGRTCCAVSDTVSGRGAHCWGDNEWSLLGPTLPRSSGSNRNDRGGAVPVLSGDVQAVDLNTAACAIQGGAVHCWGATTDGQLGDGVRSSLGARAEPQPVAGVAAMIDVAVGRTRSCAVSASEIYCWGVARRINPVTMMFEEVRFDASPTLVPR